MAKPGEQYLHKKSGSRVNVVDLAKLQTGWPTTHLGDMDVMVIYEHGGGLWVRSEAEFDDGRFELVSPGGNGLL